MNPVHKWITARSGGRCRKCWGDISRGMTILWLKHIRESLCLRCGEAYVAKEQKA